MQSDISPRKPGKSFRKWAVCSVAGIGCAALLLLLLGAAWIGFTEWRARRLQAKALTKWAAIGRPMPAFEKTLARVEENASLKELTKELEPFGIHSLYKWPSSGEAPNTFEIPQEVVEFLGVQQTGDIRATPLPHLEFLEQHAEALNRLYVDILRREPPVWEYDCATMPLYGRVPNFLTLRLLAQCFTADAAYRLAKGDQAGAANATAAGVKLTQNLGEQPALISWMVRVALQALFARSPAALPEDPQAWERLATDAAEARKQFLTVIQAEAWIETRFTSTNQVGWESLMLNPRPFALLPKWAADRYIPAVLRLDAAKNAAAGAEAARVYAEMRDFARGDLGKQEVEKADNGADILTPSFSRAYARLNFVLLLREQAEMIRFARARVQEGKAHAERPSVVIPGAHWEMNGDLSQNSASLKLTPIPPWVLHNDVIDETYFLLPLDGSRSWQFAPKPSHGT